jgi:hypothetical protein
MNALPGTLMVDTGAPARDRAAAVWALSHMVAALYHPRHQERASVLGRQLAFTGWHGSDRATQRGDIAQGVCGLFGLGCHLVDTIMKSLREGGDADAQARFAQLAGMDWADLSQLPAPVILELCTSSDLLAAGLAAEAYRVGGPLPGRCDPQRCAQTWLSRMLTVRGPERHRHQATWAQGFRDSARELLELLD